MNQFITLAVSEKMTALLTVDYLKERAKKDSKLTFKNISDQVSDAETEESDKL